VVVTALVVLLSGCAAPTCAPPKATAVATKSPIPSASPTPTAPLQLTPPTFHAGEVGVDYTAVDLAATGGLQPYTWTISIGALPDGLTLATDGHVSGTPTRGGGFSFTVQVSDAGGSAVALPSTIAIAAAPSASLIPACARYCSVEVGCVEVCGAFGTLTGGTAPFTYAIQPGGFVPVGTHLNALSLAGTFTQRAQFWQFTVLVTDALGQATTISPTFYVFPHISLSNGTCTTTFYLFGCKASLPYSGGTPSGSPQVSVVSATGSYCPPPNYGCQASTTPPPGFSATVSAGQVLVSVAPANRPGFAYTGTVTLRLTDQSPCGSGANCSTTATVTIKVGLG
jgi:large repetitive protein